MLGRDHIPSRRVDADPQVVAASRALSKADTAAIVPQCRVAALVVMGTRDPDFPDPTAEARRLAGQLGAESVLVEGAGHYPHTEMPDRVVPKLLSFIGGLGSNNSANPSSSPVGLARIEVSSQR